MVQPSSSGLAFSTDTLVFDTVFTSVGSTTRRIKVINPNRTAITIHKTFLGSQITGAKSPFRLNINGIPANSAAKISLAGLDSLYIFAEVTINPTQANAPIMVYDSVIFETNQGTGKVYLVAVGQNAVFFNGESIPCGTVFTADKPYVIYNSALVDSSCTLTINAGARIYFGPNSSLFVRGTLHVNGTQTDSVIFRGDRIDPFYRDLPGTWNGIHLLLGSINNKINHADIRNGLVGIRVDSLAANADTNLVIRNSQIRNMALVGIVGFTAWIEIENTLLTDCGRFAFVGDLGGRYAMRHVTIGNFSFNFSRGGASLAFTNADNRTQSNNLQIEMLNTIVWGDRDEELQIENIGRGNINLTISNSLIKTKRTDLNLNNNLINLNPRFVNPRNGVFEVDSLSPALKQAIPLAALFPALATDLKGRLRSNTPTIGCFE